MTTVRQLAAIDINTHWSVIGPMLNAALVRSKCNDYNIVDLHRAVTSAKWDLFVAEDSDKIIGAAAVIFQQYPKDTVAYIAAVGGKMIGNKQTSDKFFDLLRARGAARVQGAARPSIVRLWRRIGLEEKYAIVEGQL
jgi:hypothetical protein